MLYKLTKSLAATQRAWKRCNGALAVHCTEYPRLEAPCTGLQRLGAAVVCCSIAWRCNVELLRLHSTKNVSIHVIIHVITQTMSSSARSGLLLHHSRPVMCTIVQLYGTNQNICDYVLRVCVLTNQATLVVTAADTGTNRHNNDLCVLAVIISLMPHWAVSACNAPTTLFWFPDRDDVPAIGTGYTKNNEPMYATYLWASCTAAHDAARD